MHTYESECGANAADASLPLDFVLVAHPQDASLHAASLDLA
jgi:hypothetical protein